MYVDAFVAPVKTARKDDYIAKARAGCAVFLENGATSWTENWADDVSEGKVTSFPRAVQLQDDETVVFSWITYPDRATRDACMKAAMQDPRMQAMMDDMPMDGKRMFMGGFETIVQSGEDD
jgi:uncharacterized protein YbaA (DUF1428 family)